MVILGLLLLLAGAAAILAGVFLSSGSAEFLGADLSALTIFLIGVAAGAAVLWGFGILKWGTKRSMAARKDRKELNRLQDRLDRAEAQRHEDDKPRDEHL